MSVYQRLRRSSNQMQLTMPKLGQHLRNSNTTSMNKFKKFLVITILLFSFTSVFAQKAERGVYPPTKEEFIEMLKLISNYKEIQLAKPEAVKKEKHGDKIKHTIQVSPHLVITFYTTVDDKELQEYKKRLSEVLRADPQITQTRKNESTWVFHAKKGEVEFDFEITNEAMKSSTKFWSGFAWGTTIGVIVETGVILLIIAL